MKSGIYQILNTMNGKRYIGQSRSLNNRKYEHFCQLSRNEHGNSHLQNAYNLYGEENFEWSVIEYVDSENLTEREQYWVNQYGQFQLYNSRMCVDSPAKVVYVGNVDTGKIVKFDSISSAAAFINTNIYTMSRIIKSKSALKKVFIVSFDEYELSKLVILHNISLTIKKLLTPIRYKRNAPELHAKLSANRKGRRLTQETKNKISQAKTGKKRKPLTEEHKQRIGKANKGRIHSYRGKTVCQIDTDTRQIIKIWDSASTAAKSLNGKGKNINQACMQKSQTYGFLWEYKVNYENKKNVAHSSERQ